MSDVAVSLSPHQAVVYVDGAPVPVIIGGAAGPPGAGGALADGDYGDVVVSGAGSNLKVESATPADGSFEVTGSIVGLNSIVARAETVANNAAFWMQNEAHANVGILYWERAGNAIRLRRYAADHSTAEGVFSLLPTGASLDMVAGGTFTVNGKLATSGDATVGDGLSATAELRVKSDGSTGVSTLVLNGPGEARLSFGPNGTSLAAPPGNGVASDIKFAGHNISFVTGAPGSGTRLTSTALALTSLLPVIVPADPYGSGWSGSNEAPTKGAVYAKMESLVGGGGTISDAAYGPSWDGSTTVGPSQNAIYDKLVTVDAAISGKANTSALASYLPLTGGSLTGGLGIAGNLTADGPTKIQFLIGGVLAVEINPTQTRISSAQLVVPGTAPTILLGTGPIGRIYGSGVTQTYRADAHHWEKESGGAAQMDLSAGGNLTTVGQVISGSTVWAQTNRRCFQQGSPGIGPGAEIYAATAAPTAGDGNNGDIWLQYV